MTLLMTLCQRKHYSYVYIYRSVIKQAKMPSVMVELCMLKHTDPDQSANVKIVCRNCRENMTIDEK